MEVCVCVSIKQTKLLMAVLLCTCQFQAPPTPDWAEVGICKVESLNAPTLGTMLLDKSLANPHVTRQGLVGELTRKIFIKYYEDG